MKTVLAGTAFSIFALFLWGFTLSRETGEANKEPQPGIVHPERNATPKRTTAAPDPRVPVTHVRSSATPRLSHFLSTEPRPPEGRTRRLKRPPASPVASHTEGSQLPGGQRLPRAEREDVSFATSHKLRRQPADSPFPLRNTPQLAAQVPPTTPATIDVDPTATVPSPSSSHAADEDFRYRQIYGQHAWMARHIRMHNGVQEDEAGH
ncbi:hypothetical protein OVA24_10270 [Luteolibacter sp. SL250]|uniref:hypothetical protein n=1 Tax=Luteolibacter sp. SL250 TaxID=2995170 RepID=UPI0022721599|nr:hypothetical protein [Luteolibacter sp. SL250]WAC21770.1 hypothetical protein OVA24_10270 [Luteolibacter sp. SL250]